MHNLAKLNKLRVLTGKNFLSLHMRTSLYTSFASSPLPPPPPLFAGVDLP